MAMPQETEVKLYTPDLNALRHTLDAAGAHLITPRQHETNIRYEDSTHSFVPRGIVLRLRQDDSVRLTYKDGGQIVDGIITRTELEVTVSDFDIMNAILEKLGYVRHMVYEKYRSTYELDDAEILLDEMPYGNFTEIEGDHESIERLMARLGLQEAPRMPGSYARIFDHVRRHLGLSFNDLTFENFEGLHVPESVFTSFQ